MILVFLFSCACTIYKFQSIFCVVNVCCGLFNTLNANTTITPELIRTLCAHFLYLPAFVDNIMWGLGTLPDGMCAYLCVVVFRFGNVHWIALQAFRQLPTQPMQLDAATPVTPASDYPTIPQVTAKPSQNPIVHSHAKQNCVQ